MKKLIWSILCGTALGLGGCYDSGDRAGDDAPPDAEADDAIDAVDQPDEVDTSPPIDTVYGPPFP